MAYEDSVLRRSIMHEMAKHQLTADNLDVHVNRGIIYLSGVMVQQKTPNALDAKGELERVVRIFRTKPGVRDVVVEVKIMQ